MLVRVYELIVEFAICLETSMQFELWLLSGVFCEFWPLRDIPGFNPCEISHYHLIMTEIRIWIQTWKSNWIQGFTFNWEFKIIIQYQR